MAYRRPAAPEPECRVHATRDDEQLLIWAGSSLLRTFRAVHGVPGGYADGAETCWPDSRSVALRVDGAITDVPIRTP
jgi:hypothetical protein